LIEYAQHEAQTWKTDTHNELLGGMVEADELTDTGHNAL